MGYRSEVLSAIAMPSKDFLTTTAARYKLQGKEKYECFEILLKESVIREMDVQPAPWVQQEEGYSELPANSKHYILEFHITEWKWYDDYPEIQMWEEILREAVADGLCTLFIRLGEEVEDIVEEYDEGQLDHLERYIRKTKMFPDVSEHSLASYVK